jgi:hypothetical protein
VAEHFDTEAELIGRAQEALSQCSWTVGECAAAWTQRYAKGRTDADFGALVGLSGDQVYQRRRVWESFHDVRDSYPNLKWSHLYAALTWDDAAECLQWANEMTASIAEMKAWRRAQRGEDLSSPADEEPPFDALAEYVSAEPGYVRAPDDSEPRAGRTGSSSSGEERERAAVAAGVARDSGNAEEYAPFGKNARGPAAEEAGKHGSDPSTEQVFKRLTAALEKCDQALTPGVLEEFADVPVSVQQRFLKAINSLSGKAAGLS